MLHVCNLEYEMDLFDLDSVFRDPSTMPNQGDNSQNNEDPTILSFEDQFGDSGENMPVFDHNSSSDNEEEEEDFVPVSNSCSSPIPVLLSSSAPGLVLGSLNRSPFRRSPRPHQIRQSGLTGFMRNVATQTCQTMDVPDNESHNRSNVNTEETDRVRCNHLPLPDVVQHGGRPVERGRSASVSIPVDNRNGSINFTEIGQTLRRLSDDFEISIHLRRFFQRHRCQSRSYSQNDVSRELWCVIPKIFLIYKETFAQLIEISNIYLIKIYIYIYILLE